MSTLAFDSDSILVPAERRTKVIYMSGKSKSKRGKASSSRGKTKIPKKILEGRKNKTKIATLKCGKCGKWFEDLGQINQHYSAAGHKRDRKPPKKIRFAKDYTQSELELTEALIELLKDPLEWRRKVREKIIEQARRSGPYGF